MKNRIIVVLTDNGDAYITDMPKKKTEKIMNMLYIILKMYLIMKIYMM